MKKLQITSPLLQRGVIFLIAFIAVSGLIGVHVISGGIVERYGFAAYGSIGKTVLFGAIAYALIARRKALAIDIARWQWQQLVWAVVALVAACVAWISISKLIAVPEGNVLAICLAHGGIVVCIAAIALCCFGLRTIQAVYQNQRSVILQAVTIAVLFYIFLFFVYMLWKPLAAIVLASVRGLLTLTEIPAIFVPPASIMTDKFGITVAQYCSGIESIALFSGLYAVVGLMDWNRIQWRRYLWLFPVALVVLFGLNIVRVFALILAGYYINPEIAFSLFHTYAGMLFFIIYSGVFWAISYKYILKQPTRSYITL